MRIQEDAWIIADTHFNHYNMIEYRQRPFFTVGDMNDALVYNWNSVVRKNDQVIFLGDFSLGNDDETQKITKWLNGRISMIMGDHDQSRSITWWKNCGFETVIDHPVLYNHIYILSHEPENWVANSNMSILNIHGHTHKTYNKVQGHPYFNVSAEATNYAPIQLGSIMDSFLS